MERLVFCWRWLGYKTSMSPKKTCCAGELCHILQNQWVSTLIHVIIKRIQIYEFLNDLANLNECWCVTNWFCNDLFMRISRWSALWNRNSLKLFTPPITYQPECQTFVKDAKNKRYEYPWWYRRKSEWW